MVTQKWERLLLTLAALISCCQSIGVTVAPVRLKDSIKGQGKLCLRYEAPKNTLVMLRLNSGQKITGQSLNMQILDASGNVYRSLEDLAETAKMAFTTSSESFDVCFENYMVDSSWSRYGANKEVILDVEIGQQAREHNSYQRYEKYNPILQNLDEIKLVYDLLETELNSLLQRERGLRNINENSLERYIRYQVLIITMLVTIGVCQLVYYRNYFKFKKLI